MARDSLELCLQAPFANGTATFCGVGALIGCEAIEKGAGVLYQDVTAGPSGSSL